MRKILSFFLCLCLLLAFLGCASTPLTDSFYALNTVIDVTLSPKAGEDTLKALRTRTRALETLCSRTDPDGALYALNHGDVAPPEELYALLTLALEIAAATDGAFDPTLGALVEVWRITDESAPIPTELEVSAAKERCGYQKLTLADGHCTAHGVTLDLGAIAKGYIAERLVDDLLATDVPYGILWLGGNVAVFGQKPDGEPFRIALEDPRGGEALGYFTLTGEHYISVSGGYQRQKTVDGVTYHHVFDSATGYPSESELLSVAVISQNGVLADALSTALFVMGEDRARDFYENTDYEFSAVLVRADGSTLTMGKPNFTKYS
ncbi:MAG: FAD:protein FMN transferase [Clostridia bacterium]|nr:FAD:protein FMN transferase [Clostridia bacterium]